MSPVTAILWTLVAVVLVCWFAGLVAKMEDDSRWSHVGPVVRCHTIMGKTICRRVP